MLGFDAVSAAPLVLQQAAMDAERGACSPITLFAAVAVRLAAAVACLKFQAYRIRPAMRIDASTQDTSIAKACGKRRLLGLRLLLAAPPP